MSLNAINLINTIRGDIPNQTSKLMDKFLYQKEEGINSRKAKRFIGLEYCQSDNKHLKSER